MHKGAELGGTVRVEIQLLLHWPSWVCPKEWVPFSNFNKDAYRLGGQHETDHTRYRGKGAVLNTTGAWNILFISLNFRKSDGFKASPSCGNSLHKNRPSGVTKDITAIKFIKKAWQSMSHALTAFQMPLINGCANYTFIAINFISIIP